MKILNFEGDCRFCSFWDFFLPLIIESAVGSRIFDNVAAGVDIAVVVVVAVVVIVVVVVVASDTLASVIAVTMANENIFQSCTYLLVFVYGSIFPFLSSRLRNWISAIWNTFLTVRNITAC